MRIAVVSDAVAPFYIGGKETRLEELTNCWSKRNHIVTVFCMIPRNAKLSKTNAGVEYKSLMSNVSLYAGRRRSILQATIFAIATLKLSYHLYKYDVVYVDHMPYLHIFPLKILCVVFRKRMVATWHESLTRVEWKDYMGRLGSIAYIVERLALKLPDKIEVVSEQTLIRLREVHNYTKPILLAGNGISLPEFSNLELDRDIDVLYVGRFVRDKNVDLLIASLKYFVENREIPKTYLVGSGPEKTRLVDVAKQENFGEAITWLDSLPHKTDVYKLMLQSKLLILPSLREGYGLVVAEALAAGCQVITTSSPLNAARFMAEEFGGKVIDPEPQELAETIQTELENWHFDAHKTRSARSKFNSWELVASRIEVLFCD
jgi:glycosyltransferase involved in cell wall biosynthesis